MPMPNYTREQLTIEAKLTPEDLEQVRRCRHAYTRLGFAYQLAFVRLLNRFPRQEPFEVQDEILTYVGMQLDLALDGIVAYSRRRMTVSAHQERIRQYLGLTRFSQAEGDLADGKSVP